MSRCQGKLPPAVCGRPAPCLALLLPLALACGGTPTVDFEDPDPADVLYERGEQALVPTKRFWVVPYTDTKGAIESYQAIIDNYPYSEYAVLAELRIADAYFERGDYEEALSYYRDFGDLHPEHEKVPYTIYQSALCHAERVEIEIRDQTATRDALVYLDRLISRYPYSEYTAEAETLWRDLRLRLAKQVMSIGDFYRRHGEYEAAAERYRSLLSEYPGLGLDASALLKLGTCYDAMLRCNEAERLYQAVLQNYRESDAAEGAEDRLRSPRCG